MKPSGLSAPRSVRSMVVDHSRRYPLWEVDDLYKLLHQRCLGSEHAVRSEAGVRDRLRRELAGLGFGPPEPLIDHLSPDGPFARIHLRPFAAESLDPEALLQAFLKTASAEPSTPPALPAALGEAAALADEGLLGFSADRIVAFAGSMKAAGFPAVHHSPRFREAYRPAYRVVAIETIPPEILSAAKRTLPGKASGGRDPEREPGSDK